MKYIKFISSFVKFPQPVYAKKEKEENILFEPAIFEAIYVAQKDYNNTTKIIATIINTDVSFDEFYHNLSVGYKSNIMY